jgi:two-component system LytT family sensor kinase
VLEGSGASGIGLKNVHGRLQATFGTEYGLRLRSVPGEGTAVTMTVPKFRAGVRAA